MPFFFCRFTAEARGFTLGHLDDPGGLGTFGLLPGSLRPGGVQADHRSVRADAAEHEQGGWWMGFLCIFLGWCMNFMQNFGENEIREVDML